MWSWELKLELHACKIKCLPPRLHAYNLDKTSFVFHLQKLLSVLLTSVFLYHFSSLPWCNDISGLLSKHICQDCCSCQFKMLKRGPAFSSNLFWEKSHSSSSGSLNNTSIGRCCDKYLTLINLHGQKTEGRDLHGSNPTHSCNLENNHWTYNIFQVYSRYSCQKKKKSIIHDLIWETKQKICT